MTDQTPNTNEATLSFLKVAGVEDLPSDIHVRTVFAQERSAKFRVSLVKDGNPIDYIDVFAESTHHRHPESIASFGKSVLSAVEELHANADNTL